MNEIEKLKALIAELKSGEYKKGYWKLHGEDAAGVHTYCVMGVACELYRQRENKFDWIIDVHKQYGIPNKYNVETRFMPDDIRDWYGFTQHDCNKLSRLNDSGGRAGIRKDFLEEITFLEILLNERELNATQ